MKQDSQHKLKAATFDIPGWKPRWAVRTCRGLPELLSEQRPGIVVRLESRRPEDASHTRKALACIESYAGHPAIFETRTRIRSWNVAR